MVWAGLIGLSGSVDKIYGYQYDALRNILRDDRMFRLSEAEVYGADVPSVSQVLEMVSQVIFTPNPDRFKRQLQRQLVDLLIEKTDPMAYETMKTSDLPAIYRVHLKRLQRMLAQDEDSTSGLLEAHYEDLLFRIKNTFRP